MMLNRRLTMVLAVASLVLSACSSEKSSSDGNKVINEGNKAGMGEIINSYSTQKGDKSTDTAPGFGNSDQKTPELPTRSELRVLSEQSKETENEAQNVIKQFDAHLDNPDVRKDAQAKFKQILPEYKGQMLKIGKAKLKEVK